MIAIIEKMFVLGNDLFLFKKKRDCPFETASFTNKIFPLVFVFVK
jgi:hypothetical protein